MDTTQAEAPPQSENDHYRQVVAEIMERVSAPGYGVDLEAIKEAQKVPWAEAVARGRWDVQFWARRFLGVDLHPGQLRFVDAYLARNDALGWRPRYFDIALAAGNRAGKTMVLAVVIWHSCFYKMGSLPLHDSPTADDARRWSESEYVWFHFAIKQAVADELWSEFNKFLQGVHEAQPDGFPMGRDYAAAGGGRVAEWERKEDGMYRWIVFAPELGGAEIKFRTTEGSKGTGSLGKDMHGISFDEAGLEDNLKWIYDNVLRNRRLGTGGQIIFISTPEEGFTEFSDYWFLGDPEAPDRKKRNISLRLSSRENIGYGLTMEVFLDLVGDMDENAAKQTIDGYFIQGRLAYFDSMKVKACFTGDLPEHSVAAHGHLYLQGVDPGLTDRCWSLVFDWKKGHLYGVKAEIAPGKSTEAIVALAVNNHSAYAVNMHVRKTRAATAIDTTGLGGHMFRDLVQQSLPDVTSVEFGGNLAVKRKLLGDLKTFIEEGKFHCPDTGVWLILRKQLLAYKLADRGDTQDGVMCATCVVKLTRTNPEDGTDGGVPFDATMGTVYPTKPKPNFRRRRR